VCHVNQKNRSVRQPMSNFTFESMFGANLQNASGDVQTATLAGKNILIYFSAHWCGPCRGFTPKLSTWYKAVKAKNPNMECVFVSSDKTQADFNKYFAEMPWLALPFDLRDTKGELSKLYKVSGIPTLVVVGPDGKLITKDGRSGVMSDPEGLEFPWKPKSLAELMDGPLLSKSGEVRASTALANKPYGIYFSAHWCPPCRGFTPKLAATHAKCADLGKPFEVVFVSGDRDAGQFDEYFGEMPWLAIPYTDKARIEGLNKLFNVEGIPSLIIVGADGKVVNPNARGALESDPECAAYPWAPQPVVDLDEGPDGINESPSIVVLCEGEDDATKAVLFNELKAVAVPVTAEAKARDADPMCFFIGTNAGGLASRIRQLVDLSDAGTRMVLMDIPDQGAFYSFEGDAPAINAASIHGFIASYKAKTIERKQLSR